MATSKKKAVKKKASARGSTVRPPRKMKKPSKKKTSLRGSTVRPPR